MTELNEILKLSPSEKILMIEKIWGLILNYALKRPWKR